jgi:hypothetical protein
MFVFKRVNVEWKLDIDRSMKFVVHYSGRDRAADPAAVQLKLVNLLTKMLNDVAGQIETKQLDAIGDVSASVERAAKQAFSDCRVNQLSMSLQPAVPG